MVFLDTNFLIAFLRNDIEATLKMEKLKISGKILRTTAINLCELYNGAFLSKKTQKGIEEVDNLLSCIEVVNLDSKSAKKYSEIHNMLRKKGDLLPAFDVLIAAIVVENNDLLITRDKDFERIKDVKIEEW